MRWRVALIAIAAAGITALATLGGQLWAASINSGAARDVARTNFSLTQQVSAYSKHVTDQSAFRAKADAILNEIHSPFPAIAAQQDVSELKDLLTIVEQDDSIVAVVGSPLMVQDSKDVLNEYQNLYASLIAITSPLDTDLNILLTPALSNPIVDQAQTQYQSTYPLAQRFADDANAELGG